MLGLIKPVVPYLVEKNAQPEIAINAKNLTLARRSQQFQSQRSYAEGSL
jgi:hypothetical protein